MGINIYSNSGNAAYGVKEYIIDTVADIDDLPKTGELGSAALCLENGEVYFFRPDSKKWLPLGVSN